MFYLAIECFINYFSQISQICIILLLLSEINCVNVNVRTLAEHNEHLSKVFLKIRKSRLKLNKKKCQIG